MKRDMQKYYKCESEDSVGLLYVEEGIGHYDAFLLKEKLHCKEEIQDPKPCGSWKEITGDQYAENMIDLMNGVVTPKVTKNKEGQLIFINVDQN